MSPSCTVNVIIPFKCMPSDESRHCPSMNRPLLSFLFKPCLQPTFLTVRFEHAEEFYFRVAGFCMVVCMKLCNCKNCFIKKKKKETLNNVFYWLFFCRLDFLSEWKQKQSETFLLHLHIWLSAFHQRKRNQLHVLTDGSKADMYVQGCLFAK